ncbi:hypothetical protein BU24DRAFT_380325 [Aaosphaeria arxii CBS 175.79]|uniref:Uncharacterized protein n=1 Tax=Aaosphaeria arxii CBS 175.79 TaxID=1450172 RepID=A0A6A5X9T3_9PLEO|nr:uncharacterized protein BU24DRAFT_380325 [Aaosphaeria arxii CBS 175.79]KAF2009711.1 hypothetical protein BU24DRAFT_380325 [Aaosphaeria arxii CBS 175.79]
MANITNNIGPIIDKLPINGWNERCVTQLEKQLVHLVDAWGHRMETFTDQTWGITLRDCYQFCSLDAVPYIFNFQTFASAFTNFLLPWLALTAQLPYETSTPWDNLLSLCLSVGSPALITYSLTLTILNRYSLRTRWHTLQQTAQSRAVHDKYTDYSTRVKAIQFLLQEAQQVPLRASQERGWLSSLIVGPKNQAWWKNLQRRLMRTRRGVTFSLVAQIAAAAVAWLFTIASGFIDSRGDRVVANQLSSGTLWLWLIPVIWGWVTVGTQNGADSIDEALRADVAYRAKEPPLITETSVNEKAEQRGIMVRSVTNLDLPGWLGADIMGDEKRVGPIFNYARVFTWWQLARTVESALSTTVNAIATGETCKPAQEKDVLKRWNSERRPEENLAGDSWTTAQYCGLELNRGQILAYPEWSEITPEVWKRIIVAGVVALFVQWGTTGPGILIAYYTPTRGIGCRTASYLVYGGLGTLVWILLAASMFFSHAAMGYERSSYHSFLCGCAVVSRVIGKTLAIGNALWLVLTALLEYTGVYDRCYCRGNQTSLGMDGGWVALFKTQDELAHIATSPWAGAVAMSILICFGSYLFFWLGSRTSSREEY